jgi:predicted double-glycine peptidase
VTLVGVRPDAVLITDPWFGQVWHPKAQFESAYSTFNQMAVILTA